MKSIVCVNTEIPTVENWLDYSSEGSLRDYDIVLFDPRLPVYNRIHFSGGGSCISIEDCTEFTRASSHWSRELSGALASGKTVFIVLSAYEEDQAAVGSKMPSKGQRTYSTSSINNYSSIPGNIHVRNARGRGIVVKEAAYSGLYDAVKEIMEYRVVFDPSTSMQKVFAAKDGTPIGGVMRFKDWSGVLVLLPHFDFHADNFITDSDDGEEVWSSKAIKVSHALVGQLVEIERYLQGSRELTAKPDWLDGVKKPKSVDEIVSKIAEIDTQIDMLRRMRDHENQQKLEILEYSYLLYETGKPLERAISKTLALMGYTVETLQIGDLEIDHVIVGPSGKRMIGESEGKNSSAIDITKFRQLESNIGEDFEREDIEQPAKGILFGNGFRLSPPEERKEQFTQKSLINAKRLGSALIRTSDLYSVAVYLLDHPEDESFKVACRTAIEDSAGVIVSFPTPQTHDHLMHDILTKQTI